MAVQSVKDSKLLELSSIGFFVLDRQRMEVIRNGHNFSIGTGPCKFVYSFPFIKGGVCSTKCDNVFTIF